MDHLPAPDTNMVRRRRCVSERLALLLVDLAPATGRNQRPDCGPDSSEHTCDNSRILPPSGVEDTEAVTILVAYGADNSSDPGTCAQPNQRIPAAMRGLLHRNPH